MIKDWDAAAQADEDTVIIDDGTKICLIRPLHSRGRKRAIN